VDVQDFSDLVAQKAAQQKRKAAQAKESGKSKKQKSDTFQVLEGHVLSLSGVNW